MREIRQSGSEGGMTNSIVIPTLSQPSPAEGWVGTKRRRGLKDRP